MAKEVLTKLSNDDLVQVCGGQIYFATGGKGARWYVPTPPSNKYAYSGWFTTEKGAVNYARVNGLWLDVTRCESYRQARLAAEAYGIWFNILRRVPKETSPEKWDAQYMELTFSNKVSSFNYSW